MSGYPLIWNRSTDEHAMRINFIIVYTSPGYILKS